MILERIVAFVEQRGLLLAQLLIRHVDGHVVHEDLRRVAVDLVHLGETLHVVGAARVEQRREEGVDAREVGRRHLVIRHHCQARCEVSIELAREEREARVAAMRTLRQERRAPHQRVGGSGRGAPGDGRARGLGRVARRLARLALGLWFGRGRTRARLAGPAATVLAGEPRAKAAAGALLVRCSRLRTSWAEAEVCGHRCHSSAS